MANLHVGIDFGTSNTHVAYCNYQDADKLTPETIPLGDKNSTTTCVLWRLPEQGERSILAYGTKAVQAWNQFEPNERLCHRLSFGFKPDLVFSERARQDAWAFLFKVCQDVCLVRPDAARWGHVVVGIPAECSQEHRECTKQAIVQAGFASVECLEEPLGALAYHLNNGDLSAADVRRGVVVIDFGGGTLDVALVNSDGLRAPWGDTDLGGRLFDDLFYQWLCDQNNDLTVDDREALVVWQHECRMLKENFSSHWRTHPDGDKMNDFIGAVHVADTRKKLRQASVSEFLDRARSYRPSRIARDYFRQFSIPKPLNTGHPINLLDWIRETLARGLPTLKAEFAKVILTGGSASWPFMRDFAAEVFRVDPAQGILRSANPESTIGSGLALFAALKMRNDKRRNSIQLDVPRACDDFGQKVSLRLQRFTENVADAVVAELMPRVENVLWDWYRNGGSLAEVERHIEGISKEFEPNVQRIVERQWQAFAIDLNRVLFDQLRELLQSHDVVKDLSKYELDSTKSPKLPRSVLGDKIAANMGNFMATLTAVSATITTAVIAAIKIKLILLAAIAHPFLMALVGIGALLAALGLGKAAKEVVERTVKDHSFNALTLKIMHVGLWESKFKRMLEEGREMCKSELRKEVSKSLDETSIIAEARSTVSQIAAEMIADLTVLEQFRDA